MTYEEQVKLDDKWAFDYTAERTLQIRELAKVAAESEVAYTIGGYRFPVVTGPYLRGLARDSDPLPQLRWRDITVSLAPFLQGTPAAQLIAERIITEQWDAEPPEA